MTLKPLLLVAGLLAATAPSFAQTTPAAVAAATQTREMAERLKLNEAQYIRLLRVNRTRLDRQQEIELANKTNPARRSTLLAELQGQYEQECSRILSPSQLSQLQQDGSLPTGVANGNG
ncbi:hypothetical protein HHL22_02850 [Hymenobacter sp. RP-2-7]|uniref:DUF4168 domain-containing protein n=1 Tax=Hymenobacter polaris TaxID=2682546 RepID=A0A7Y0AB55_9BACT|nr:hypothetical protein [Hymenobacter polaris]NML64134.1 hypothetical protein [Hymenobacter polaris]